MDKSFKNEGFSNIKIKSSIAKKFRVFVLKNKESNSMTLDQMLEFFERHQLSPNDEIPNHLIQVEKRILKRINAVIAILKDIEKTQTKPTLGMLQALFMTEEKKTTPMYIEKKKSQRTLEEELKLLEKSDDLK